jgi:hypothetical protein
MHKGLRPRPSVCGSSPLCILAGSLLFTAINRVKITFDYDKCTLCHIIIIGIIFTDVCEVPWGYQSWLKVTFFPLCAQKVLVQAPSEKTRFSPPSALKGTYVKAKIEAGWLGALLPRPRVVRGRVRVVPPHHSRPSRPHMVRPHHPASIFAFPRCVRVVFRCRHRARKPVSRPPPP